MAPARRNHKPRRARDENGRNLRELAVFLEEGKDFRLGLAMYDVPRTREEWLGRLAVEMEGRSVHLLRLDLSREPGETLLLRRLEEILRTAPVPEGTSPAVMVTGLEATMDFRPMPGTLFVQGGELLRNANLQRDAYPERCPAPVVIWLNSAGATAFTQTAPDLGQWCTGIFQFTGPENSRAELEKELVSSPLIETEGLSREAKRERIGLLHDLLLEVEKSTQGEAPGDMARRAALHYELGHAFLALSEAGAAVEHLGESLELARRVGDRMMEEGSLGSLGIAEMSLGNIDQAVEFHEKALELAERVGDRRGIRTALGHLGIAHARRGELDRALDFLRRDLEASSQSGDPQGAGRALNNIGVILMQLNRHDEALACLEQALEIARISDDQASIGADLNNLGWIHHSRGKTTEALACYEEALEVARRLGNRSREYRVLNNLGSLHAELGQADRGIEMLERAVRIAREIRDPEIVESAERNLRRAKELDPEWLETTKA
jgi:tetratricopeptide (TPR) repeat protein